MAIKMSFSGITLFPPGGSYMIACVHNTEGFGQWCDPCTIKRDFMHTMQRLLYTKGYYPINVLGQFEVDEIS